MKIDRRGFLSFVAGGAAGTALSPLPWKLMDDFSIWSQAWPWVPVPKSGESTYTDTICSLCPGGCGISVRKIDSRAVKIEGLKGHPVNNGSICSLGLSGLQLLYGPTRVKSPMRRVGNRGSGSWQKISWDEAISLVVKELASIRNDGDVHKVACISDLNEGTVPLLMERLLKSYGSYNFTTKLSSDVVNRLALKVLCGSDTVINFDFKNSDFILSFGSGLSDGWNSPARMIKTNSEWSDRKVQVVQVEPVLSNTASKATQWIPINPGTEADLAFGIAAFMIEHGLYDVEFVSERAVGFYEWSEVLKTTYSLESVHKTTGIDVDVIVALSRSFANASRPVALSGRGKGTVPASFRDYASAHLLNILKGNINKSGGVQLNGEFNYANWPSICIDNVAKAGLALGQLDRTGNPDYLDSKYLLNHLISDLKSNKTSLRALFFIGSNPCYTLPDTASVKEVLKRIPFLVSFSSFMDETAIQADLILPDHIYLERFQDIRILTNSGRSGIGLSTPVVSAQFDTRHLGETIINIAHSLGGSVAESFPWLNYEECLEDSLGDRWDTISSKGFWIEKDLEPVQLTKFDFTKALLPATHIGGNANVFPFLLLPYDSLQLSSGHIVSTPFMVKTVADTVIKGNTGFIDINPSTAKVIGLDEGDGAVLSTSKGEVMVKIHLCDGVRPGLLMMQRGLGHTAYGEYIAGKGINVNDLIGPLEDPVLGHDAVWGIRAKLVKA